MTKETVYIIKAVIVIFKTAVALLTKILEGKGAEIR